MRKLPGITWTLLLVAAAGILFTSCNNPSKDADNNNTGTDIKPVPAISFSILSTAPHDTSFFTEGLEFYNNTLLESTGLKGKSRLVQTEPATGKILRQVNLDPQFFGEGITVLNDTIYQLTWQEHVVHVYTAKDFKKVKELPLNGEGWGLTNDGKYLIASTGSSDLFYYEPQTFKLVKTVSVTNNGSPVPNINELEYVNGVIYANIWLENTIIRIDPATGAVTGRSDLSDLARQAKQAYSNAEVLNGIAYNPSTKKFHVTGKNWPMIFELQFAQ